MVILPEDFIGGFPQGTTPITKLHVNLAITCWKTFIKSFPVTCQSLYRKQQRQSYDLELCGSHLWVPYQSSPKSTSVVTNQEVFK